MKLQSFTCCWFKRQPMASYTVQLMKVHVLYSFNVTPKTLLDDGNRTTVPANCHAARGQLKSTICTSIFYRQNDRFLWFFYNAAVEMDSETNRDIMRENNIYKDTHHQRRRCEWHIDYRCNNGWFWLSSSWLSTLLCFPAVKHGWILE